MKELRLVSVFLSVSLAGVSASSAMGPTMASGVTALSGASHLIETANVTVCGRLGCISRPSRPHTVTICGARGCLSGRVPARNVTIYH